MIGNIDWGKWVVNFFSSVLFLFLFPFIDTSEKEEEEVFRVELLSLQEIEHLFVWKYEMRKISHF